MRRSARRRRSGSAYSTQNKIKLIRGGRAYFDQLLQMIQRGRSTSYKSRYISMIMMKPEKKLPTALIAAAKRNVQVYLMADGYASQGLSRHLSVKWKKPECIFVFLNHYSRAGIPILAEDSIIK